METEHLSPKLSVEKTNIYIYHIVKFVLQTST